MADSFAVHLGGGAYLDSSGTIVFGPPTGAQVYEAPAGFKVDTKKIQDAAKDLRDLLPNDDDAKKKWMKWGVPQDIVEFLSSIAGAAGIIATAISVYAWAIGVLITIMDLVAEDGGMSPDLAKALSSIKTQLQGLEQIQRADQMIAMHAEFDGRIDRVRGLLTRLSVENPDSVTRAQIFGDMRTIVDELAVPLSRLRNQEWAATYDADSYKGRAFASSLLVFESASGALPPVPMQAPNVTMFDYRLGVPMLLYGATAFTSLVQIAMPWFRSAGMYAGQLRKTAEAIDRFVLRMQEECLARTEYTADTVAEQDIWSIFEMPMGGGPRDNSVGGMGTGSLGSPPNPRGSYAVGAFDLVRYDDAFLTDRYVTALQERSNTGVRGLFNYHWTPASTSLDDIAAEANERAKQDYANQQIASGMLRLISTAAWLRYLSTPPDRSQTVSGFAADTRHLVDETAATATSPSIPFRGVIQHDATRRRYNARVRAQARTQEPGYVPAFHYRVVLRTINSQFGTEGWRQREYVGDVWHADYVPASGDPRCKRLATDLQSGLVLSEIVLYEGPSPSSAVNVPLTHARIRATTFDWYVPIVTPYSRYTGSAARAFAAAIAGTAAPPAATGGGTGSGAAVSAAARRIGSGGVSLHVMGSQPVVSVPPHVMNDPAPLGRTAVSEVIDFDAAGIFDTALDKAERRHVKIEDVDIDWQLSWAQGMLDVRVSGRPESRPFQFHIVVEETVYSGETGPENIADPTGNLALQERIHTAFAAEMVNQIMMVPEEFFVEERKAIEAAMKMWNDFQRRYAKSRRPGPGDPVELVHRSIDELVRISSSTSTLAATLDKRVEFASEFAPELWNEVLRNAGRAAPA
jgi:hypothetical protein